MERVARIDHAAEWSGLTLILTDDDGIAAVNRKVFGRNNPTDVISLRYGPAPNESGGDSAELIVNIQRALTEGTRRSTRKWGPNEELALYIAHGCNHLSGEDDTGKASRNRMRRRELRWLREERAHIDAL